MFMNVCVCVCVCVLCVKKMQSRNQISVATFSRKKMRGKDACGQVQKFENAW